MDHKKKIEEQIRAAEDFRKGIGDLENKLRGMLDNAINPDKVEKTRCITGSMISIMGDGSVRIKFDAAESRDKFYEEYK